MFAFFNITGAVEMTLGANMMLKDLNRLQWRVMPSGGIYVYLKSQLIIIKSRITKQYQTQRKTQIRKSYQMANHK